jgi:hypothetical protein
MQINTKRTHAGGGTVTLSVNFVKETGSEEPNWEMKVSTVHNVKLDLK